MMRTVVTFPWGPQKENELVVAVYTSAGLKEQPLEADHA